jgi:ribosomal RNA-processing protein 36
LSEVHENELKTLRDNLKRARRLLNSSPRDLHTQREQEVARLELAVKKAESAINKERVDKVEHEALAKAVKEEQTQRKQGKGRWWMKRC